MRPAQHTSNNDVLGAPAGATVEECNALAITRVVWAEQQLHGVVSYWRPGPDELRLLNAGALVRLSVIGRTHPPLFVGVDGDGLL